MRFFLTMLLVLLPLAAQDTPPAPQKKGGGFAPKNLKVLKPEEVRAAMGSYVAALGVAQSGGCNFCHAEGVGRDSDDNHKKVVARAMILMVNDLNGKIGTAKGTTDKVYITCYTCHRGKNIPETAPAPAGQPQP